MHGKRVSNRRSQKTKVALRQALAELIHEKPYDDLVVKEILARANVGRSTFYAHYKGKEDLLFGGFQDVLLSAQSAAEPGDLLWFSRPVLEHIEQERRTRKSSLDQRRRHSIHGHLYRAIADRLENDVKVYRRRQRAVPRVPESILARWITSTFLLVLDWWADCQDPPDPREVDQMVRRLLEPALKEL